MFDYLGEQCPHCKELFRKDVDIAVCPDCGTPHHRACFAEHGQCANVEKHAAGYDWQRDNNASPVAAARAETFTCPACGRDVLAGSSFCNYCGTPFNGQINPYIEGRQPARPNGETRPPAPPEFITNAGDYYEAVMDEVERAGEIDGISVKDWSTYIGSSAGYYLGYFKIQDRTGRKTAFTVSAMFFPVIFFLYRKAWVFAAAALASGLFFSLPAALVTMQQTGLLTLSNPGLWGALGQIGPYLSLLINLMWGLYAVSIYRRTSARRIKAMRTASATEQEYQNRLARTAGPSMTAVALFVFAVAALVLLGQDYLGFSILQKTSGIPRFLI